MNNNGIIKTQIFHEIQFTGFQISTFQKEGTKTAILKQKVVTTTTYPAMQVGDNLNVQIVPMGQFGVAQGKSYSNEETRVVFVLAPTHMTEQQFIQNLATAKAQAVAQGSQLRIIKRVSNNPATLLSENQKAAMANGKKTLDDYANSMVSRYGKDHTQKGQLLLDKEGNPQYRDMVLVNDAQSADSNTCGNGDVYISAKIQAELNSTISNPEFSQHVNTMFNQVDSLEGHL